jgi:hypothetical protein
VRLAERGPVTPAQLSAREVWLEWHGQASRTPAEPLLQLGRQERIRSTWPDLAHALDALPTQEPA